MNESERKALFSVNRMAEGFLSTLLEDAQYSENDLACEEGREPRDTGTIYSCPESTLRAVLNECDAFRAAMLRKPSLAALLDDRYLCERIGADLYLERAGHGAGFRDRDCWHDRPSAARIIGEALSAAVPSRGSLETYIGDDGETYIFGKES